MTQKNLSKLMLSLFIIAIIIGTTLIVSGIISERIINQPFIIWFGLGFFIAAGLIVVLMIKVLDKKNIEKYEKTLGTLTISSLGIMLLATFYISGVYNGRCQGIIIAGKIIEKKVDKLSPEEAKRIKFLLNSE